MRDITNRKRAEEALRASETRYRGLLKAAQDGILILDVKTGMVVDVNPFLVEMLGFSREQLLGKRVYELGFLKNIVANQDKFTELQQREYICYKSLPLETADGQQLEVEFASNIYTVDREKVILCSIRDVTKLKCTEQSIRRLATVVRDSNDAITVQDFEGRITAWNHGAEVIYGYSEEEALQMDIWHLTPPEQQAKQKEFNRRLSAGEMVASFETRRVTKDGRILTVWLTVTKLLDDAGKPIGIATTERDITDRKRAEEALRASEVRYRRLFEAAKDGILILDAETGIIVDVNPFLIEMLGFPHEQLVGKAVWEIGLFKDVASNKDKFMELQRQKYVRYEDLPLETANGRQIDVEFVSNIYTVDHQKVIQCNVRDITERKRLEKEIKSNVEMKSKFTSMASHELRSPLGVIKEGINLVLEGLVGNINDEQRDLLDTAKKNTDRLGRLINNVLDFQKMDSGKMWFDIQENDINEAVLEVNKAMSLVAKEKGLDLAVDADDSIPKTGFDRDKIIQVLTNLVSNAIKYTEKGSITVSTKQEDNAVHVIVQDTGTGIKAEDVQKLFRAFEQLGGGIGKKKGGTGLGLAISKEIILAHKGKIWAESEAGKGSSFHFILPIKERRTA